MELREQLAALCHEQWSGWMEYLFSQCKEMENGSAEIPWNTFQRWQRQMRTSYSDLSEEEKESDRKEADKFLAILESQLKQANEKIKEEAREEIIKRIWQEEPDGDWLVITKKFTDKILLSYK